MSNPLLAARDGRLFLGAQALDQVGAGIAAVALPWLILDAGGSHGSSGLAFALTTLPYLVFALPAGVLADRIGPRRLLYATHALQALAALVLPVWALAGTPPLTAILAAAFAVGAGRVFTDAGAFGAVAALIGRERYTEGQALLTASWSAGLLLGPVVGGALVAVVGPATALAAEAAAFLLAAIAIAAVGPRLGQAGEAGDGESAVAQLVEGLRFIWHEPVVRTLTAYGACWGLIAAASLALPVALLRDEVGLDGAETGLALAVLGLAGVLAAPAVGPLERRLGEVWLLVLPNALFAVGVLALSQAHSLAAVLPAQAVMGACETVSISAFVGIRQRRAPADMQGRVGISGRMFGASSLAIGSALASALADVIGVRAVYVAAAVGTVIAAAIAGALLARARRVPVGAG